MNINANTFFLNEDVSSIFYDVVVLFDPVQTIGLRFACRQVLFEFDSAAIRYAKSVIRAANIRTGMFDLSMRCEPSFDTSQFPHALRKLRIDVELDYGVVERFRTTYATDVKSGELIDADARMHVLLRQLLHLNLSTLHIHFVGHEPSNPATAKRFTPSWLLRICISDFIAALAYDSQIRVNASCLRISYDALDTPGEPQHPEHGRWYAELCEECRRKCDHFMENASTVYWAGVDPPFAILETVDGGKGAVFAAYSKSKWRLHLTPDGEDYIVATEWIESLAESCVQRRHVEMALADVL
jgi:hypothetical protein